jgi:aspartate 1-decarboxylase
LCQYIICINIANRFTTYAIRGKDNSGVISVNGAAAHKAQVGDLLIIASYASYSEVEVKNYAPTLLALMPFWRCTSVSLR